MACQKKEICCVDTLTQYESVDSGSHGVITFGMKYSKGRLTSPARFKSHDELSSWDRPRPWDIAFITVPTWAMAKI